jgi:hypothetical protein
MVIELQRPKGKLEPNSSTNKLDLEAVLLALSEDNAIQGDIARCALVQLEQIFAQWLSEKRNIDKINLPSPEKAYQSLPVNTRRAIERRMQLLGADPTHTYQVDFEIPENNEPHSHTRSPIFNIDVEPLSIWRIGREEIARLRYGFLYEELLLGPNGDPFGLLHIDFQSEDPQEDAQPLVMVDHRQLIDAGERQIQVWTRWVGEQVEPNDLANGVEVPLKLLPENYGRIGGHPHMVYFDIGDREQEPGLSGVACEPDCQVGTDILSSSCSPYSVVDGKLSVLPPWISPSGKRASWDDLEENGYIFNGFEFRESKSIGIRGQELLLPIEPLSSISI